MAQVVQNLEEAEALTGNTIYGAGTADWGASARFEFTGTGNILYLEEGVKLGSVSVRFPGNNALIVLRASRHRYQLHLDAWSNTAIYLGRGCYYNGRLSAIASEGRSIVVGDECLFSFGIWIRTADPHLVYDATSHERINPSADVCVGDHVWVGQDAMILKGTTIGSGSIVGGKAVVAGKRVPSNESWAGNPARKIRAGIFWEDDSVHNWTEEKTKSRWMSKTDKFLFARDAHTLDTAALLDALHGEKPAEEKLALLREQLDKRHKNRFYLEAPAPAPKQQPARSFLPWRRGGA